MFKYLTGVLKNAITLDEKRIDYTNFCAEIKKLDLNDPKLDDKIVLAYCKNNIPYHLNHQNFLHEITYLFNCMSLFSFADQQTISALKYEFNCKIH